MSSHRCSGAARVAAVNGLFGRLLADPERADELAAACEGAATPALFHTRPAVPLSGREREIVRLAVGGLASKDIADRLFLSVRTVNNHLQHAYTKLGVTSRAGLAEALRSPA